MCASMCIVVPCSAASCPPHLCLHRSTFQTFRIALVLILRFALYLTVPQVVRPGRRHPPLARAPGLPGVFPHLWLHGSAGGGAAGAAAGGGRRAARLRRLWADAEPSPGRRESSQHRCVRGCMHLPLCFVRCAIPYLPYFQGLPAAPPPCAARRRGDSGDSLF